MGIFGISVGHEQNVLGKEQNSTNFVISDMSNSLKIIFPYSKKSSPNHTSTNTHSSPILPQQFTLPTTPPNQQHTPQTNNQIPTTLVTLPTPTNMDETE